jgi:hypothetical protein
MDWECPLYGAARCTLHGGSQRPCCPVTPACRSVSDFRAMELVTAGGEPAPLRIGSPKRNLGFAMQSTYHR